MTDLTELDGFGFPRTYSYQLRREIRRAGAVLASRDASTVRRHDELRELVDGADVEHSTADLPEQVVVTIPFVMDTGGMRVLLQLAAMLQGRGCDVDVVQLRGTNVMDANPLTEPFPHRSVVEGRAGLTRLLRERSPDAVLVGTWIDYVAALEAGTSTVLGYSAGEPTLYGPERFDDDLNRFNAEIHRLPIPLMAGSRYLQERYRTRFGRTSHRISTPVSDVMFRQRASPTGDGFRVAFVGNPDVVVKDLPETFRQLQPLRAEGVRLVLATPVDPGPAIAALLDEMHVGPFHADVAAILARSDALLYPSSVEGLGLPPLEAMAVGLPAILCPNGGGDEYARDGDNCLVVPVHDYTAMTTAIRSLRDDPALRDRIVRSGTATAAPYHEERIADALARVVAVTASIATPREQRLSA